MLFHIHTIFDQSHCERVQFSVYDWKGILFCSCFVYFILLSSTALIWRKRNPKVGMRRGTDVTVICLTVRILPGEEGGTLLQFSHLPVDPKLLSRLLRFFFGLFFSLFCFVLPHIVLKSEIWSFIASGKVYLFVVLVCMCLSFFKSSHLLYRSLKIGGFILVVDILVHSRDWMKWLRAMVLKHFCARWMTR